MAGEYDGLRRDSDSHSSIMMVSMSTPPGPGPAFNLRRRRAWVTGALRGPEGFTAAAGPGSLRLD
eukprot:746607-Hanusia_phi.AAC.1